MSINDVIMLTDSDNEVEPEEELTRRPPVRGSYGPQTIQRAGKEVAKSTTPIYDINFPPPEPVVLGSVAPESVVPETIVHEPTAPTIDIHPTMERPPACLRGSDIQEAVSQWIYEEGFPRMNEAGESSSAPQTFPSIKEPLAQVIPVIIARMMRYEIRYGHMEDNIERLPEIEDIAGLQGQIFKLENLLKEAQGDTDTLRRRTMESTVRSVEIGQRMTRIENRLARLEAIAESIKDFAMHLAKKDLDPK